MTGKPKANLAQLIAIIDDLFIPDFEVDTYLERNRLIDRPEYLRRVRLGIIEVVELLLDRKLGALPGIFAAVRG